MKNPNPTTFGKCVNTKSNVRNFSTNKSNNKRSLNLNWNSWRMQGTRGLRVAANNWLNFLRLWRFLILMTTLERPSMPKQIPQWKKRHLLNESGLLLMLWRNLTENWWRKRHLISIPITNMRWLSVRPIWEMACSKHNKTGSRTMTWKLKGIYKLDFNKKILDSRTRKITKIYLTTWPKTWTRWALETLLLRVSYLKRISRHTQSVGTATSISVQWRNQWSMKAHLNLKKNLICTSFSLLKETLWKVIKLLELLVGSMIEMRVTFQRAIMSSTRNIYRITMKTTMNPKLVELALTLAGHNRALIPSQKLLKPHSQRLILTISQYKSMKT